MRGHAAAEATGDAGVGGSIHEMERVGGEGGGGEGARSGRRNRRLCGAGVARARARVSAAVHAHAGVVRCRGVRGHLAGTGAGAVDTVAGRDAGRTVQCAERRRRGRSGAIAAVGAADGCLGIGGAAGAGGVLAVAVAGTSVHSHIASDDTVVAAALETNPRSSAGDAVVGGDHASVGRCVRVATGAGAPQATASGGGAQRAAAGVALSARDDRSARAGVVAAATGHTAAAGRVDRARR
eukprot:ctg_2006.g537